jgi:KaiC/GvpD/RAD55 family RecA-like ATPase
MVALTETGIDGLDRILHGGLVRDSTTLVNGNPGTGKSLLGFEYLYNGVDQYDEDGICFSFEERAADIRDAAESFGLERWGEYVESGRITVFDKEMLIDSEDYNASLEPLLTELAREDRYDRLLFDSLNMFTMFMADGREKRQDLLKLTEVLSANGLTTLITKEQGDIFTDTDVDIENFLADGSIYLFQRSTDQSVRRYLWVEKMRKHDIESDIFPMRIDDGGFKIYENASAFSMMNDAVSPF